MSDWNFGCAGRAVRVRGHGLLFTMHDGETIGSILNRLWPRIGRTSGTALARELTNSTSPVPSVSGLAPRGIAQLADLLGVDPLELVCSHTLIPYFESAHPSPTLSEFLPAIIEQGHRRYSSTWKRQLVQFCLMCFKEDTEHLGEPLLRRVHQLPGVAVCARHRLWLTHSCGLCGWHVSKLVLSYPVQSCPQGHPLRPQKPDGAFELDRELEFARWSEELLAFRPGDRSWPLDSALHGIASDVGLCGPGWKLPHAQLLDHIASTGHPLLMKGSRLLSRVSKKESSHVLCPSMNRSLERLHPVAVMLCVKALLGPDESTLEVLRSSDPEKLSPRGKWLLVSRSKLEVRLRFLVDFARARLAQGGVTPSTAEDVLAGDLGVTSDVLRRYKRRSPELSRCLDEMDSTRSPATSLLDPGKDSCATDIPKNELRRLLAVLRRQGRAFRSESLLRFARDFAREAGITYAVLDSHMLRSPALRERVIAARSTIAAMTRQVAARRKRRLAPDQCTGDKARVTAAEILAELSASENGGLGMRLRSPGRKQSKTPPTDGWPSKWPWQGESRG